MLTAVISKLALAVTVAITGTAMASPARADNPRVVLVQPDPSLADAVRTALVPWRVEVVVVDDEPPPSTMPAAARAARAIAIDNEAGAIVWIAVGDDGASLWIYDVVDDQVVARPLATPPPFAPDTAAAAALTVKTLLRHSAVAPVRERLALPRRTVPEPRTRFETTNGARFRRTEESDVEPRLGFALVWWSKAVGGRAGVALRAESGPGISVSEGRFIGRFTDTTIGLAARGRFRSPHWLVEPSLGLGVHFTGLDGAVFAPDAAATVTRVNTSVDAALMAGLRLPGHVEVGVRVRAAAMVRSQRYLVQGQPILTLPRTELDVAVVVGAGLF